MSRVSFSQLQNASRSIDALRELFPDPSAAKPAALPAPPPFDAATLPVNQQAALIHLTESHIKRAIVSKLLEDSQDFLHDADFAPLRDLGLAEKPEGYRLNKLTDDGNAAAKLYGWRRTDAMRARPTAFFGFIVIEQLWANEYGERQWRRIKRMGQSAGRNARRENSSGPRWSPSRLPYRHRLDPSRADEGNRTLRGHG